MTRRYVLPTLFCLVICFLFKPACTSTSLPMVTFQSLQLPLKMATTPETRLSWLKGRSCVLEGLFVFDFGYTAKHSFHMHKVYLPLIAYGVDEKGQIQSIFHPKPYQSSKDSTEMENYESDQDIRFFYFLPKSLGEQLALKKGQTVETYPTSPTTFRAVFNPQTSIFLLLAFNTEERARGLMYRRFLKEGEGMLFLFREAQEHSFWMKNCKIPLSLAYLDEKGRIGEIHQMEVPPQGVPESDYPRYLSEKKYDKVLEVPYGWFKSKNIKVGDVIQFEPELSLLKAKIE